MLILVILPFLLTQIGFDNLRYISLIHLLSANMIFHISSGVVLVYIIISNLVIKFTIKVFENII